MSSGKVYNGMFPPGGRREDPRTQEVNSSQAQGANKRIRLKKLKKVTRFLRPLPRVTDVRSNSCWGDSDLKHSLQVVQEPRLQLPEQPSMLK